MIAPQPTRLSRRATLAVAGALAVLALAGCGSGGSKKARFEANLEKLGLSPAQASCVTDHLYASLTSQEIDDFYSVAQQGGGNQAAIPLPLRQKLYAAITPCAPTSAPSSSSS